MQLHPVDWIIVGAYCLGMVALGGWFSWRQHSPRNYFLSDRDAAFLLVLASIVATETSTVTFLSVPGKGFAENLAFLQLPFGFLLGRAIIAWWLLPQYFRGELYSAYQVLHLRFGPLVQRAASALFLLARTLADGLRLYLTGLFLQVFLGFSIESSILTMAAVTLAYTYLGGIKAILWTDFIQFVLLISGAVAMGVVMLQMAAWSDLADVAQQHGKLTCLNLAWDPSQAETLWAGLVGGAFLTMATHGADQMMVQRYLCSRSLLQARAAVMASGVVVLAQFLLFLLLGVGLFGLQQLGHFTVPPGTRSDQVVGLFMIQHMPLGLKGLMTAAVLAAAMSTLAASWNSSASAVVFDFYKPWRPGRSESHYLAWSKAATLAVGGLQTVVALTAIALASGAMVDRVLTVAGFTTGLLLGLFILGSMPRPVGTRAALSGLAAGFTAVTAAWAASSLAWPWYAPLGTAVTVTAALGVQRFLPTARPTGQEATAS